MTRLESQSFVLPIETRRHIGRRLAAARKFRRLEPPSMETALGESPGFIARLESDEGAVAAEDLHRMMALLGIGARFFHDGAPEGVASLIAKTITLGHEAGSFSEIAALLKLLGTAR